MRVKYDVDTKVIFQIGDPLDHTCSAFLSNAMYDVMNVNAVNLNCVVKKGELKDFCDMVRQFHFNGFNITMPHKSDIIKYLDECDEFSRMFNSVNHVKLRNGRLIGTGIDGKGMRLALEYEKVDIKGRDILILGAGAVSGPIAAELSNCKPNSITILNRTLDKAKNIADKLNNYFEIETRYGDFSIEQLNDAAARSNLLIQCTSLGMDGHINDFESVEFVTNLRENSVVAEVIYNPPFTKLLSKAKDQGYKVVNGMGMLVHQMRASIAFHFGLDLPESAFDEAEESLMVAVTLRQARRLRMQKNV